jgi:hypothetical protein
MQLERLRASTTTRPTPRRRCPGERLAPRLSEFATCANARAITCTAGPALTVLRRADAGKNPLSEQGAVLTDAPTWAFSNKASANDPGHGQHAWLTAHGSWLMAHRTGMLDATSTRRKLRPPANQRRRTARRSRSISPALKCASTRCAGEATIVPPEDTLALASGRGAATKRPHARRERKEVRGGSRHEKVPQTLTNGTLTRAQHAFDPPVRRNNPAAWPGRQGARIS